MMLDRAGQSALASALDELRQGSSRRFEDKLWLGFGDGWIRMRTLLIRDGAIREVAGETPSCQLLVRGEALRLRLEEALAPKAGGSGTAISVALTTNLEA